MLKFLYWDKNQEATFTRKITKWDRIKYFFNIRPPHILNISEEDLIDMKTMRVNQDKVKP